MGFVHLGSEPKIWTKAQSWSDGLPQISLEFSGTIFKFHQMVHHQSLHRGHLRWTWCHDPGFMLAQLSSQSGCPVSFHKDGPWENAGTSHLKGGKSVYLRLVVRNMSYVCIDWEILIPTDFYFFHRGRYTTNQIWNWHLNTWEIMEGGSQLTVARNCEGLNAQSSLITSLGTAMTRPERNQGVDSDRPTTLGYIRLKYTFIGIILW